MPTVLIVDDEKPMRDALRRMLDGAGLTVVEAADGRAALEVAAATAPDLVITDLIMPGQEGIGTIAQLKRRAPAVKVIAISGGGPAQVMDFLPIARRVGADASLAKPFRKAALLDTVTQLLRGG